jgi:catechol 2,3-dioxygenase-like lactoylglutathione lyase family enzyme
MPKREAGHPTIHHHVAVRVSDLDRSIAWYQTAFGLDVEFKGAVPEGVPIAMLRSTAGAGIELFELELRPDPEWSGPIPALEGGATHFALSVADLEAAYEQAGASGARLIWPPRDAPIPDMRIAFVADPDGNLIELVGPVAS